MTQKPEPFVPTEEQIQRVLQQTGGDPRKLAIAYLRAQNRARENGLGFGVMTDVNELFLRTVIGDEPGADKAIERAKSRIKTFKEVKE